MNNSTAVTIDVLKPEYYAAYDALNRRWLVENGLYEEFDEPELSNPKQAIIDRGGVGWAALLGEVVVGTCALVPLSQDSLESIKLAVDPDYQRRGIARKLVKQCLEYSREKNMRKVVLISNSKLSAAIALYRNFGFVAQPIPDWVQFETADVYMELELNSAVDLWRKSTTASE